jgi:pimeloyl-ACP methyl ester carboxylesterase
MSTSGETVGRIMTTAGLVASIVLSWPMRAAAGRASSQDEREIGMEFQKGYAPVDGLRIYYEIHGTANSAYPPLVLLHGGGDTIQTSFGHLLPELARSRQVIAFEQQGFGHTADIADRPFSFGRSADNTAALLQYLHVEQADVFGFSNGSTIALQVAIRHPRLVRKLVIASGFFSHVGADPAFWNGFEHAQLQQMPLSANRHEEFWARVEELEPRQRPLLSDIMGHGVHERARSFVNGGSTSRCKRL